MMFPNGWVIAFLFVFLKQAECQGAFNFPDDPQPTPADSSDTLPGLEGRQAATTLPTFPTLPGTPAPPAATTVPPTTAVAAVVTPAGQTCICVPTGSCNTTGTGSPGGEGLIDIRIVTNVSPTNPPVTVPTTPPITSCGAGLSLCCRSGPYQCGVRYPPVAGSPVPAPGQAPYGSYPWQAVLLATGDVYLGSGVLLNNLNVLTVAHRAAQYVNAPATLRVRMGEWNSGSATEPIPAQEFIVSRVIIHPNYNAANLKNDVAILRLSTPVPLGNNPAIATGCLPATSFVGSRCFVSGWGRNDFVNGTFQTIQKQVDVPILQPAQCQSQLAATRLGPSFVFDPVSFICAGSEAGKDACTGDGGSPLMCSIGDRWFIAGLVAWGIGCGTINIPGVYVNVASFVPWIQTTVAS
ncbi:Phenoloxidase-activating factor 2 [Pseudolycoriella hygida]|uniref:Phenoloxidase-activating factor 2 n=1 Tax=Pseudolycoriella hygida TaxID=35572 RepID=A0A9Q0RW77_9DIPT|nr:Phenoloxidase-activating factor 2 [Pseudolycoriella hygida]